MNTCRTCKHYDPFGMEGHCLRYPPIPKAVASAGSDYPVVTPRHRCGEWTAQGDVKAVFPPPIGAWPAPEREGPQHRNGERHLVWLEPASPWWGEWRFGFYVTDDDGQHWALYDPRLRFPSNRVEWVMPLPPSPVAKPADAPP